MLEEVRARYDAEVRQRPQGEDPSFTWEWDGDVFRVVGPGAHEHENTVVFSDFADAAAADAGIARQLAYFRKRGKAFEWKLYAHDRPADLADRLARAGLQPQGEETVMVFDLERAFRGHPLPNGYGIDEIVDPDRFAELARLHAAVYGDEQQAEWLAHTLADEYRADPSALRMFYVRAHDELVSAGWLRLAPASPFASLWGGMTRTEWRARGCYTALVARRLDIAREAGFRWVTVDCTDQSRPILERRGFDRLATVTPFVWRP